jgi:hypothetical protein
MLELWPSFFRALIFAIASRGECIELKQNSTTTVKECSEELCLLDRGGRWGDRSDERDTVRVDGEVVVEGIVKEREQVDDLWVDLEQAPKREIGWFALTVQL